MSMQEYYEALDRLKTYKSVRMPKGTKITNDSVSLEAGRGKGSIKKSRPAFAQLIIDIDEAATKQSKSKDKDIERSNRLNTKITDLQSQLDAALAREMSLVYELFETRKRLANLTGEKVFPIKRAKEQSEQVG